MAFDGPTEGDDRRRRPSGYDGTNEACSRTPSGDDGEEFCRAECHLHRSNRREALEVRTGLFGGGRYRPSRSPIPSPIQATQRHEGRRVERGAPGACRAHIWTSRGTGVRSTADEACAPATRLGMNTPVTRSNIGPCPDRGRSHPTSEPAMGPEDAGSTPRQEIGSSGRTRAARRSDSSVSVSEWVPVG